MTDTPQKNTKALCPRCNKVSTHDYRPFCSARCKSVDLGHWLSDSYVIAGSESASLPDVADEE